MTSVDFWFSIGSTYTYLSVARLAEYGTRHGVSFNWLPFNVRSIMIEQKNVPFAGKPEKSAYMWRDIQRRAEKYRLPAKVPAPYPLEHLELANRVALVGQQEGWVQDYTIETYRRWFVEGEPAGSEPNISHSIRHARQDADRVLARAHSAEIADALVRQTARCRDLGVFGAPSYVVDGEVFWGDDRLDDAVSWRKNGRVV